MSRKAVKKSTEAIPFHHVNRKGDTYYLHQGETKTGKPRYFFAKTVREGFLTEMPAGFEVSESVNGIVSVRRKRDDDGTVSRDDIEVVRAALRKQARLRDHRVEVVGGAIVVFEPDARRDELRKLEAVLGRLPKSFVDDRMRRPTSLR